MSNIVNKVKGCAIKAYSAVSGLSQKENERLNVEKKVTEKMPELLRSVAAEGAVLLENDGTLPFKKDSVVSLFGRIQIDWFYTGYGSGGDVNKPYAVNLVEGLENCSKLKINSELADIYKQWCKENPADHGFWGNWPRFHPEMPLKDDIVKCASKKSDYAVVVLGRSSGEDRENALEKGSYFLTDEEHEMLRKVTSNFEKVVVLLNIGSIIDMSWVKQYKINSVMIVWQGGMESGNAVCDLLCGAVSPSGKLSDTIATSYEKYPSALDFGKKEFNNYTEDIYVGYRYFETFGKKDVAYPFGFGLSYTDFEMSFVSCKSLETGLEITCNVKNVGSLTGKETVEVYVEKPCEKLGNPYRELCTIGKTRKLAKGKDVDMKLFVPFERFASYDESGITGFKSAYVIEKGNYIISLGNNVRDAKDVYTFEQKETILFEQLSQVCAPKTKFNVLKAKKTENGYKPAYESVFLNENNLKERIVENYPLNYPMTGDRGYKLADVKSGKIEIEEFVSQLTLTELEAISRGDYTMDSPLGAKGNAGVFAGVTESLRKKGVPAVTTTDGPSGIRLYAGCSLIPIGTLLACTFNEKLVNSLFAAVGEEMKERETDVLLAPGMNIHRNPLCGRNFEYYSEDPFLTGKMAASAVSGLQSTGVSACPKHFCCNNQEFNRNYNDSRVSERALREIYLKGFEICVKQAKPKNIMTSYNKINGVWGHYNYDTCTTVLRGEWGYEGNVMTDWWMRSSKSPEFENICDQAYRVRAQVDVLMPGGKRVGKKLPDGTLLSSYSQPDGIRIGEMQRTAKNVLNFALNSQAFIRMNKEK